MQFPKNNFLVFMIVMLTIPASASYADAKEKLINWQTCLELARTSNPSYLAAQAQRDQARQELTIAYADRYPQLSLSASSGKNSSQDSLTDPAKSSASLSFKQLLFDGFQSIHDTQIAELQWQQAQNTFQTTTASLRYDLHQTYTRFLKNHQLVTLTQAIKAQRQQNLNLVKLRYQGGREHAGSLKSAEANLAQARFEVQQAKRSLALTQQQLAQLLGLPLDQTFTSQDQLTQKALLTTNPDLEELAKQTPQYQSEQLTRDIAEKKHAQAYSAYYPSLNLNASTGVNSDDWEPDHADWSASLSLSYNLFDGGNRGAQLQKSKRAFDQAELELRSTYESLWLTLASQWNVLRDAQETIMVKEKLLAATRARSKIANAQYSNGLVSFEDWSSIEDALVSARKASLDAQASYTLAHAKWQQLLGVDFHHE